MEAKKPLIASHKIMEGCRKYKICLMKDGETAKLSRRMKREVTVRKILVMVGIFISMKGKTAQPSS